MENRNRRWTLDDMSPLRPGIHVWAMYAKPAMPGKTRLVEEFRSRQLFLLRRFAHPFAETMRQILDPGVSALRSLLRWETIGWRKCWGQQRGYPL